MAKQAEVVDGAPFFIAATAQEVVPVAFIGLIIGLLAPLVGGLLATYFIEPVFCSSADAFSICATGGNFAFNISTILLAVVAIVILARLRVYRPLLIAVATAAALWGLKKYLDGLQPNIFEYYIWFGILYALSYLVFFWLLRIRNFAISAVAVLITIVLTQWVLIAS